MCQLGTVGWLAQIEKVLVTAGDCSVASRNLPGEIFRGWPIAGHESGIAAECTSYAVQARTEPPQIYNESMKGLIGLLLTASIGVGLYMYFLKQASPGPGMVATQAISLTGVENDLIGIGQAERMYFAQNGSYADLATLTSSGTMNIARNGRDGYTYAVETSATGFTATARYTAPLPQMPSGVPPPHFPTVTLDQTMEVHQSD